MNPVLPAAVACAIGLAHGAATGATLDLNGTSQQAGSLSDYVVGSHGLMTNSSGTVLSVLTLAPSGSSPKRSFRTSACTWVIAIPRPRPTRC